jgi:hypothetical protein
MCNIHQNGWRITWGTQPKRRMSHLESRSYNKSYYSPKAYCFSEIDNRKPFSRIQYSFDFPKYRLHIVHSHPSVLLGLHLPLSHIVVGSQVPPYSHFTLIVFLYWPSLSSILLGVDSPQAMPFWSHSYIHVSILFNLSKRRSPLIAPMIASV